MPTNRPAGLPRAPAGVVAVVALALAAPLLDERGLLVPAGAPSPGEATLLRLAGITVALGALGALAGRRGARWREVPAAVGVAAAVGGTLALLTLPVSDVALDWPPPAEPAPLEPSPPPAAGAPGDTSTPPPVLRLPAGGRLEVQADQLLLEFPDGSTHPLGRTDGGGGGAALPAGPLLQLEVGPDGAVGLTDGAGTALGGLPADGGGLDLDDVRIEDAAGGGVVDVAGGTVTDAGGTASGQVDLAPARPDRSGQDVAATAAGVLLAGAAYYLVFLRGRLRPRRPGVLDPPEAPTGPEPARPADPVAAGAGLAATLEAMLADPDPRTAIVAAYARLLDALHAAGYGRLAHEAPHEHLRRVLQPLGARPGPVHDLADLFVLARFGHATLGDEHRTAAIDALRAAVDDLRAPVPA